jgi:hypothetical protein
MGCRSFELIRMPCHTVDVERVTLEMVERFGASAANIARWQAGILAAVPDVPSAEMWRDIADAIERLSPKSCRMTGRNAAILVNEPGRTTFCNSCLPAAVCRVIPGTDPAGLAGSTGVGLWRPGLERNARAHATGAP